MTNPTSNFGWQMPTSTDLVTDLPADFEVFGQAVDTDFADLLGGTTGQVLSKTSATDLDFTWVAANPGDITGVTAGTGISGGGTSGTVTVSIDTAVTADLTTAQTLTNKKLSDSTTTIVDATDATKAIKFDVAGTTAITGTIATAFTTAKTVTIPDTTGTVALTNGVINNTLTTTTGDIIYASGANTPARLGIGSSAQVLTVSGGVPSWATPASGSTFVGVSLTKSAAQTIATGTETIVTFNTEVIDTDGFHTGTDGKITIPSGKAGKYLVTAQMMVDSATFQTQGGMRKNGAGIYTYYAPKSPTAPCVLINTILSLAVADYIEIFAWQGSGVNKDVLANSYTPSATVFSATYLGA